MQRLWALMSLTIREVVRSRVLIGMTALMCLFAFGSLLWPAELDRDRVILVQRYCFLALTFFGLIAAAFLGGSSLPRDLTSHRIYSLCTKPISRIELLLGKTLGLVIVLFLFLVLGGALTLLVTHVASARKTYAGGSYSIELTAPEYAVQTESGLIQIQRGQILPAKKKVGTRYVVTIAERDTSHDIEVPEDMVRLHERSLNVLRVAEPKSVSSYAIGGARVSRSELVLACGEVARGDRWTFDLSGIQIPPGSDDVHVRFRFGGLRFQPRDNRETHDPPQIDILFRNPESGKTLRRELHFVLRRTAEAEAEQAATNYYEDVLTLPRDLLAATLEASVVHCTPEYPARGRIYYDNRKLPAWRIRGFDPRLLPEGEQTLQACFFVHYARGTDLIDHTNLTVRITNPATGESEDIPINLRDRTVSNIHFDRRLIDDKEGLEFRLMNLGDDHLIGHSTEEPPLYLLLRSGSFWASTARSILLIFFQLTLFAALAVAASTLVSAPVAILLTLVAALAGGVKDLLLTARGTTAASAPWLLARGAATVQEQLGIWVDYALLQLLRFLAPGFEVFSSTTFVKRGWAVPWAAVSAAAAYALLYAFVCFLLGYVLFRTRELE